MSSLSGLHTSRWRCGSVEHPELPTIPSFSRAQFLSDGNRDGPALQMTVDGSGAIRVSKFDEVPRGSPTGIRVNALVCLPVELSVVQFADAAGRGRQDERGIAVHPTEIRRADICASAPVVGDFSTPIVAKARGGIEINVVRDQPVLDGLAADWPLQPQRVRWIGWRRGWRRSRCRGAGSGSVPAPGGQHRRGQPQRTDSARVGAVESGAAQLRVTHANRLARISHTPAGQRIADCRNR